MTEIRGKSAKNIRGRSFLTLLDFTTDEIRFLLDLSKNFKNLKMAGTPHRYLTGKNIVLLFEKTSTRTRCSFEVAGYDLGMGVTYLDPASSQMGQKIVETLAEYAGVPVWNGLTDLFHPTQMLADILTIEENFGSLKGLKVTYMGDARNNVANSLMIACAKMGMHFTACSPAALFPADELVKKAEEAAATTGATITLTDDVRYGTKNAHVLYTDIWVSMGEPDAIWEERIKLLKPYQVTKAVMANADKNAIFLHCLPSFHDLNTVKGQEIYKKFGLSEMEVTDDVFESHQSKVFDEAENRMHTIKAVMYATLS